MVQTGAAELRLFDQRDACAKLSRLESGYVTAGTGSQDRDIVMLAHAVLRLVESGFRNSPTIDHSRDAWFAWLGNQLHR